MSYIAYLLSGWALLQPSRYAIIPYNFWVPFILHHVYRFIILICNIIHYVKNISHGFHPLTNANGIFPRDRSLIASTYQQ